MSNIRDALNSQTGSYIISIILGLGLAALFRKACKENNCIVIKGPNTEDVSKYTYKINEECYKYSPVFTECTS